MDDLVDKLNKLYHTLCHVEASKSMYSFDEKEIEIEFLDGPLEGTTVRAVVMERE